MREVAAVSDAIAAMPELQRPESDEEVEKMARKLLDDAYHKKHFMGILTIIDATITALLPMLRVPAEDRLTKLQRLVGEVERSVDPACFLEVCSDHVCLWNDDTNSQLTVWDCSSDPIAYVESYLASIKPITATEARDAFDRINVPSSEHETLLRRYLQQQAAQETK